MTDKLFRIIDANINRASEGLRVLEDLARFYYEDRGISEGLKVIRHGIRKNIMLFVPQCLSKRDSLNDVGFKISKELDLDRKDSLQELTAANFKRVQEALRTIEEYLKVLGNYELSKLYEKYRFESYAAEKEYFIKACSADKKKKLDTDLYCITAEEYSCGRSNMEVVEAMIKAGIRIIQYREKEKKPSEKYNECLKIREMTRTAGVTFIINDDIDIALLVKADGVHMGQEDLPVEKVRQLVGEEMIIGLSTHTPQQAREAVRKKVDYIGVGPIYKTSTKKDVCEAVGLEYLEYVAKNIEIPFVAIGGIKENNLCDVKLNGARCIAMITEIVSAKDIGQKIQFIRNKLEK